MSEHQARVPRRLTLLVIHRDRLAPKFKVSQYLVCPASVRRPWSVNSADQRARRPRDSVRASERNCSTPPSPITRCGVYIGRVLQGMPPTRDRSGSRKSMLHSFLGPIGGLRLVASEGVNTAKSYALFAAICASIISAPVLAIAVRHDVDDSAFIELAQRFPAVAAVRCADGSCGLGAESTLIDPRWLLTAAHVAASLEARRSRRNWRCRLSDRARRTLPRLARRSRHSCRRCTRRAGVAVTGIAPAKVYDGMDEVGMVAFFVGRGGTGTGLTGYVSEDGRIRAATNRVESVINDSMLRFRFDAPGDPDVTELEGISGPGDSGGPAFVERNGTVYVIGVGVGQNAAPANGQRGHYKVLELYTRVSAFAGWIRSTLAGIETPD